MNTAAKAALLSVGLIVLIVLGYVVFSGGDDPGLRFVRQGDGRTPDGGSRGELSPRAGTIGALSPLRQRGSIEVHVSIVDGGNKRPLSRSTLRVVRRTESQNLGDTVLALPRAGARGGDFDFQLEPGYYQLFARARGFVGFSKEVTLVEGQSPGSYVFELDRGISIAGRVLSVEGTPISGASVYAFQKLAAPDADLEELLRNMVDLEEMSRVTEHPSDVSADDGSYEIFGLELGNWYTVRAVADGFSPGENASVPAPSERVDIHLQAGGVVEGLVRSTEGGPVEGAVVEAYQELEKSVGLFAIILAKARPPVDSATADASGRYVLEKMGSGLFNFRVTAPGYQVHEALKLRVNPGQTSLRDFLLRRGNVLQGIVRGPDHQPLAGAKVRVSQIGGDFGRRDTVSIRFQDDGIATDDQGFFLFDTLREGKYTLLAWHRDYQSVQRRDVYPSEDDEITVTLGVGGQLQGRVYDMDSGEPIAGARISASDLANLRKEDVTNENGEYVLYGLNTSRRNLTVNVRATGFGRAKKEVRVSASQVVTQDFELIGSGQITGRIVTSEGDPVPGARVEVRRMGEATAQVIGHSVAESDGTFTVSDVEVGDALRVRVKKKTYLETYTDEFDLRSGQELDLGDVALSIGGAVEGFVRDEGGQAVVGAMVTARRLGKDNLLGRGGLAVQTGADGGYRIQGLETGSVDLEFKASGFVDQVKAGVKVLVGQRNINQNVVLEAAGMVAGRVIDLSGQPIPGASISVSDFSDGLQQRRAVSDGNGIFRVQNIASKDTVGIEVTHEEYGSYEAEEVAVGTTDLEVTLSALGRVIGLVLDPDGQPAISFSVHPQPVGDSAASARSRRKVKSKTFNTTDGAFDYGGIPDGVYDVHVRVPLYSTVTRAEVRVVSGEVVDLGEIILEEGGQVTGRVLAAATRSPVAGARVRIVQGLSRFKDRKSSTAAAVQVTGTDGSFAFTGLRDGTLSLEVTHQDFVRKRVSNVDTQVATKSRDLLIELEQGGEISGAVVDANGRGQVGMQVYLMSKGGSSRNNRSTPTDAQGTFSFKGISPGTYTVKAHRFSPDGGPPRMSEDEVQLRAGDHLELNLVVE